MVYAQDSKFVGNTKRRTVSRQAGRVSLGCNWCWQYYPVPELHLDLENFLVYSPHCQCRNSRLLLRLVVARRGGHHRYWPGSGRVGGSCQSQGRQDSEFRERLGVRRLTATAWLQLLQKLIFQVLGQGP